MIWVKTKFKQNQLRSIEKQIHNIEQKKGVYI